MENITLDTSTSIQFSERGEVVYFIVNIKELFNISSNYNGMKSIIRRAFEKSRRFVPIKTGLMRSSYTFEYINSNVVRLYFDPNKILGKTRLGRVVNTYYPKYLVEKTKTFNWLDIVMRKFLESLISDTINLEKRKQTEDILKTTTAIAFLKIFNDQYKEKEKQYIETKKKEEQAKKQLEKKRLILTRNKRKRQLPGAISLSAALLNEMEPEEQNRIGE